MEEDNWEEEEEAITKEGLIAKIDEQSKIYLDEFKSEFDKHVYGLREFLAGKTTVIMFTVIGAMYSKDIGFADLEEKASGIFKNLGEIGYEKGFRSHINTYREHRAVGSTQWGGYEKEQDIPEGVLNLLWGLDDDMGEKLTIEEARRARELQGLSTINEKGVVTGKINEDVKDSYHFLSPERKAQVIQVENENINALELIPQEAYSRKEKMLAEFMEYYSRFIEGEHTIEGISEKIEEIKRATKINFSEAVNKARELSYREGKRDFYLTPQEIIIMGRKVDEKYIQRPWTPIGVQNGTLSVEEAQKLREKEKSIRWATNVFTEYEMPFEIPFEELNQNGEAVCGPLGKDVKMGEHFRDRSNVPFSRPVDWYHKESFCRPQK